MRNNLYTGLITLVDHRRDVERLQSLAERTQAEIRRRADAARELERKLVPVMRERGEVVFQARNQFYAVRGDAIVKVEALLAMDVTVPEAAPAPVPEDDASALDAFLPGRRSEPCDCVSAPDSHSHRCGSGFGVLVK